MELTAVAIIIGALAVIYLTATGKDAVESAVGAVTGAVTGKVEETSTTSTPLGAIDKSLLQGVIIDPPGGGTINVSVFGKTFPITYKLAYGGSGAVSGSVDIHVKQISVLGNEYSKVTTVPGVTLPGNGAVVQQTINAEVANGFEIDIAYGMLVFITLSFAGFGLASKQVST